MDADQLRDGNVEWLLQLLEDTRAAAVRLRGRADPGARADLESALRRLERFTRATAQAAQRSEQLTLESPSAGTTERARK